MLSKKVVEKVKLYIYIFNNIKISLHMLSENELTV